MADFVGAGGMGGVISCWEAAGWDQAASITPQTTASRINLKLGMGFIIISL